MSQSIAQSGLALPLIYFSRARRKKRRTAINNFMSLFSRSREGLFAFISQRKRAEEYRLQLEAILDNVVDGLITIDEWGTILSYNKACEKIFGYLSNEAHGKNISLLMPGEHARKHDQYLKNYMQTGVGKIIGIGRELQGKRRNGTLFPMDLSVAEVRLGNKRIFSGIVRDITQRKRAEEELQRSNKELEQFAYVASHDLKAPLRGIDNLAQWIVEDMGDALTPDAREKMNLLRSRVTRLEALLAGILSYSRAGRIVDTPEKIELGVLVNAVADLHVPDAFKVEMGDMPVLVSSRTSLEQIFGNILSNAVRHHDKETGVIIIRAAEKDGFYELSVKDDGPGIPPEFHTAAFEMFQTLKPRDKTEGTGLGMAIIRKLVEWQGGKVWIESDGETRGTAIHFLWPKTFKITKME
jgi:two-component system sensor kinase FixL